MGPVSISRLTFDDEAAATRAARLLRANDIRVESFTGDADCFTILIRAGDAPKAAELLDSGRAEHH